MTRTIYYCDRCRKEVNSVEYQAATLKMSFNPKFEPHSIRAEKFIDEWSGGAFLLCSACAHYVIDYLVIHEG